MVHAHHIPLLRSPTRTNTHHPLPSLLSSSPVHDNQNPLAHAIKERTATADQLDTAFESHIAHFLAKKAGTPDLAHVDINEHRPAEAKKMANVATSVYFEPYYAASSTGVGTLAARANSVDAGVAYCQKMKAANAANAAAADVAK